MVAASVGFQCPECVKEGGKGVREARTTYGGRITGDASRVSLTLIVVNVVVYLAGLGAGSTLIRDFADQPLFVAIDGEYYRLITSAFLHAGTLHLLVNMFALSQVGPVLEAALGRVRFLALYLLAALGGSAMSMVLSEPTSFGVGASGAIFGLFGAFYVVLRTQGRDTSSITTLLIINTVIGFLPGLNIDWRAHLGGLITGAVVAAAYVYVPRGPRRGQLQALACVAVLAVIVVTVLARSAALRAAFGA
ncbi:MAG: rhomboid family intramembrane serine protease [Mycobacteriales bacterium]|nr:rhomboid family intramembrane serine protease [Mycobacteriales bacterium]